MTGFAAHPWLSGFFDDPEMAQLFSPEAEVARALQIEAAWTRAMGQVDGLETAELVAQQIETASIPLKQIEDGMAKDGVPVPALVQCLKQILPDSSAPLVHVGLTSQDVLDTSFVMLLLKVLDLMNRRLGALDQGLTGLEHRFGNRRIPAFTRLQPALECDVSSIIEQWRQQLARLQKTLPQLKEQVGIIQWGGPIGERDHPKASSLGMAFADQLGLKDPGRSWHTDRTVFQDVAKMMERIAILTGKMGEDIALYALVGSGQHISLDGGGSSAMPHKNNPVDGEALIALADFAAMLAAGAGRSARHEGHRSGQALMLEWLTIPHLCLSVGAGLNIAQRLVGAIRELGTP